MMKHLGSFPVHFAAGVLTTCLVGVGVLYGTESWKKYASLYSTANSHLNMDQSKITLPRSSRVALSPMELELATTEVDAVALAVEETETTPRSVSESDLTVEGQIHMISKEYRSAKSESTRQKLREQLSILMNNTSGTANLDN